MSRRRSRIRRRRAEFEHGTCTGRRGSAHGAHGGAIIDEESVPS